MAQIGVKTVLVDADLRTGSIGEVFDCPPDRPGLGKFLSDEKVRFGDIVESDVIPDLSIIPAGPPSENAQELLSSARFAAFVAQLLREYDLAIFDTTPANTCTDAQRVATVVGYSLIVARKSETYFNDVKALSQLLRADKSLKRRPILAMEVGAVESILGRSYAREVIEQLPGEGEVACAGA